jgi:pimeloyl-ACP methyl ester carboxylesterase
MFVRTDAHPRCIRSRAVDFILDSSGCVPPAAGARASNVTRRSFRFDYNAHHKTLVVPNRSFGCSVSGFRACVRSKSVEEVSMKSHRIVGGGGTQLHVVETGNPAGRSILFIHGLSQSWLTWRRQLSSELADDHRLVAIDMRGHGLSDKPRDAYSESKLWADDVHAVIRDLRLDHPMLSGWSYGPLVILDYIRHYGEDSISGIQFIGGVTKLGSEAAISVLTPEFLSLVPGFFATDVAESVRSLDSLLGMCFTQELSAEDRYMMLGCCVSVPPYVRQGMFSRAFDNDDLLPKLQKPVLITHGAVDAIVKQAAVDQHKGAVAHAQVQIMANAGHGPFWDDAPMFNRDLRTFMRKAAGATAQSA